MQHRFIRGHWYGNKMDKWGYRQAGRLLGVEKNSLRGLSSRASPGKRFHLAAAAWSLATVPNATGRGQPLSGLTIKQ